MGYIRRQSKSFNAPRSKCCERFTPMTCGPLSNRGRFKWVNKLTRSWIPMSQQATLFIFFFFIIKGDTRMSRALATSVRLSVSRKIRNWLIILIESRGRIGKSRPNRSTTWASTNSRANPRDGDRSQFSLGVNASPRIRKKDGKDGEEGKDVEGTMNYFLPLRYVNSARSENLANTSPSY